MRAGHDDEAEFRGAPHYRLACSVCGRRELDDGLTLGCPEPHEPGLWHTEYRAAHPVRPGALDGGLFRYRDWLPVRRELPGIGRAAVYRAERLGARLGLSRLWVAFSGYWPERGADLVTGTFKELEAGAVLGRIPEGAGPLVVSSAGNTAAAFAELCARHLVPVVLVVPSTAVPRLRTVTAADPRVVHLLALEDADYADAIAFADLLAAQPGFVAEGGTRNVARRDGLATVLLAAAEQMGELPGYYVQAIGSGAGAIAAHEAAMRLRSARAWTRPDGSDPAPGAEPPHLILAQNSGYAPVHQAWNHGRRLWTAGPHAQRGQHAAAGTAFAPELTNRRPPYDVRGGLHEILTRSRGSVLTADPDAARAAMDLFAQCEGVDIEPAAGVAVAALRAEAARGTLDPHARILLNVTGGGRARLARDTPLRPLRPAAVLPRDAALHPGLAAELAAGILRRAPAAAAY